MSVGLCLNTLNTSFQRMHNLFNKSSSIWAYTSILGSVKNSFYLPFYFYILSYQSSICTIFRSVVLEQSEQYCTLLKILLHFKDWSHHDLKDRYAFPMLNSNFFFRVYILVF